MLSEAPVHELLHARSRCVIHTGPNFATPGIDGRWMRTDIVPAKNWKCSNLQKATTRAVAVQPSKGLGDCFHEER
eukprot:COSAG04_NODE_4327_length_2154_cov_1.192701_3_plen_75_part_00